MMCRRHKLAPNCHPIMIEPSSNTVLNFNIKSGRLIINCHYKYLLFIVACLGRYLLFVIVMCRLQETFFIYFIHVVMSILLNAVF
jgi:hypothetical protein